MFSFLFLHYPIRYLYLLPWNICLAKFSVAIHNYFISLSLPYLLLPFLYFCWHLCFLFSHSFPCFAFSLSLALCQCICLSIHLSPFSLPLFLSTYLPFFLKISIKYCCIEGWKWLFPDLFPFKLDSQTLPAFFHLEINLAASATASCSIVTISLRSFVQLIANLQSKWTVSQTSELLSNGE